MLQMRFCESVENVQCITANYKLFAADIVFKEILLKIGFIEEIRNS